MRFSWLIFICMIGLVAQLTPPVFATPPTPANDDDLIAPLPRGCIRVTPPGQPEAPCCIIGQVYLDGEPVAGAEVIIRAQNGTEITRQTTRANVLNESIYETALPATVRNQTIRITAIYQGRETTVEHTVLDGSQQVDLVLPRNYATDYAFARHISFPNMFNAVHAIAVAPNGDLILAGRISTAAIVQLKPDGTVRRSWDLPSGLTEPIDLAIAGTTVYVLDAGSKQVYAFTTDGVLLQQFTGLASELERPVALAVAPDSSFVIVDRNLRRVVKVSPSGAIVRTWGGEGNGFGQFQAPGDIEIDEQGQIYVADLTTKKVQQFSADGVYQATFALPLDGSPTSGKFEAFKLRTGNRLFFNVFANNAIAAGRIRPWLLEAWFPLDRNTSEAPSVWDVAANGEIYTVNPTNQQIRLYRPMTYTRPIATIVSLSGASLDDSPSITLIGNGIDSDETPEISDYEWWLHRPNGDPVRLLGTAKTITVSNLPQGHLVSLRVRDSEGEWSQRVYQHITLNTIAWTMLLYLAGDYNDTTHSWMAGALNQLEKLFSTGALRNAAVRAIALFDGPADGDTKRYIFEPGRNVTVESLGELAMDHPDTLRTFLLEGQRRFPATYYYVAIANHGQGAEGIAWDTTSDRADDRSPNNSAYLKLAELRQALRSGDGLAPITILHLDACSMNTLELAYDLRDHVNYLIAYQYLGWSSFRYDSYAQILNSIIEPRAAAVQIAARYAEEHNDRRAYTVSVLDLSNAGKVKAALEQLAEKLIQLYNDQSHPTIHAIREQVQTFDSTINERISDGVNQSYEPYVDLKDWAERLHNAALNPDVTERANALLNEIPNLVIANHYGAPNATEIRLNRVHGVSIVYPLATHLGLLSSYFNDRLFTFTQDSRWPRFLLVPNALSPNPLPDPGNLPILGPNPLREVRLHRVYTPLVLR